MMCESIETLETNMEIFLWNLEKHHHSLLQAAGSSSSSTTKGTAGSSSDTTTLQPTSPQRVGHIKTKGIERTNDDDDDDDTVEWTPVLPRSRKLKKSQRMLHLASHTSSEGNTSTSTSRSSSRRKKRNISTPRATLSIHTVPSSSSGPSGSSTAISPQHRKRSRFQVPSTHNSPKRDNNNLDGKMRNHFSKDTKGVEGFLIDAFSSMVMSSADVEVEVEEEEETRVEVDYKSGINTINLPKEGITYSKAVSSTTSFTTSSTTAISSLSTNPNSHQQYRA